MKEYIQNYMTESARLQCDMMKNERLIASIEQAGQIIIDCYLKNGKVLIAGNGGSAGDAQHIAGELINKFFMDRKGLACVALTTDTSVLTAVGNDYTFDRIFQKQIEALGRKGDVFLGISTSGNSKDVICAMKAAKEMGMINVALTGEKIGEMDSLSDCVVKIPSTVTPHVQEGHIVCYHLICALVERAIFGSRGA